MMNPYRRTPAIFFIFALVSLLTPANARALAETLSPGDHTISIKFGGHERSAIVHVPPRAVEKAALPVVLNFHGGGGHGSNEQEYSLMDRVADQETFIAVYPNGTGRFGKRLLTWNAAPAALMRQSTTSTTWVLSVH